MATTIKAVFDGAVLRPDMPLQLPANTRVTLTIEADNVAPEEPASFLRTARRLRVRGPADWATNLDRYLDGEKPVSSER